MLKMAKFERRVCVKFCRNLGRYVIEAIEMFHQALGEQRLGRTSPECNETNDDRFPPSIFDIKGIVPTGAKVNSTVYWNILRGSREDAWRQRSKFWGRRN